MTGTTQEQKKAARIVSQCHEFFRTYMAREQKHAIHKPDKFYLQAFEEVKSEILPKLESYSDAAQLIADRQIFADRVLIMQILTRAAVLRKRDPEYAREQKEKSWHRECEQFHRAQDRRMQRNESVRVGNKPHSFLLLNI